MSSRSGQGKDKNRVLVHHDQISNALPTISATHRRTHLGEFYEFSALNLAVPALGQFGVWMFTGNNENNVRREPHIRFRTSMNGLAAQRIQLVENAGDLGQPWTPSEGHSHNRPFVNDSRSSPIFTTTAVVSWDGTGTVIFDEIDPPANDRWSQEWVLRFPVPYLLIVTSLDTVNTTLHTINVEYYEETGVGI